jgi:hypothetical protein
MAAIVPSADEVYPVEEVPTCIRLVVGSPPDKAFPSSLVISLATEAVTVAATSVSISSTSIGVAAALPSKEIPHSIILATTVALGLTCNMVLIAVPVVTAAKEAVVGIGPLKMVYSAMVNV